jgi:lysophospholipase L1-like esterase
MKLLTLPLLFIALTAFQVSKPKRVIFFGDSITQAAVNPGGYITLMQEDLKAKNLTENYELLGAGISGHKVYDLYLRLENDVLDKSPDAVVIFIGVNDVWHKASSGTGTDADRFERFYKAIIKKLQDRNIEVTLCTPAAIGERTDYSNQQDGDLNYYSNIIRKLAETHGCGLVDLRKEFREYALKNNPENKDRGILTTDRVHLNEKGNRFVADLMWKAVVK